MNEVECDAAGSGTPASSPRVRDRHVVLVAFDGLQSLDLIGPLEVFAKANLYSPSSGHAPFRYVPVIASPSGGEIRTSSGLCIGRTAALHELPRDIDTILISGGTTQAIRAAATSPGLRHWLHEHSTARRLGSICTGAFVLANAGLLDGRRATTHWQSCDLLKQSYPAIDVEADALFVRDGNIYTSAGVTSGIDLSLAMVEQDLGAKAALSVARDLVLYLRRPGGQSQFSAGLAAQARTGGRFDDLLIWIADNPDADLSLPSLAERAAMSERNFGRVFARDTGMTPACYVECVRLDRAKLYLESTNWPLARIAERSGLGSVATLIRAFGRRVGITPDAYRQRFGLSENG